jgi:D-glycero-D-manno-heptose 1,7-bisphosphate phosphatase
MARTPDKQAVFFELDGVVLAHSRLNSDGTLSYQEGALAALSRIDPRQFSLFVATNREDIAFGRLSDREFRKLCDRFLEDAAQHYVKISKIYSCPFHPKGRAKYRKESVFRKPAPGMFKMAQQEFDLNLHRCWMIGHTTTDILAGSRGGLGTILVETGEAGRDGAFHIDPHFVERDLCAAVARIAQFENALKV